MFEGRGREFEARGLVEGACAGFQGGDQAVVIRRIDHDRDKTVILRRRAQQGRAADVDVLDGFPQVRNRDG